LSFQVIDSFRGDHYFLSNFGEGKAAYDGVVYPKSEYAYQAAKTLDLEDREWIRVAPSPYEAKQRGKQVDLRPGWEEMKVGVMTEIVLDKFNRSLNLWLALEATDEAELIEGNWWGDTYWGRCKGKGENWLGYILMYARARGWTRELPFLPRMIGFTGTREGMTHRQKDGVWKLLNIAATQEDDLVLVHGDCVGADKEAHHLAVIEGYQHFILPCDIESARAYRKGLVVLKPQRPLVRNRQIVDSSHMLIATPGGEEEAQPRSGTWATVRYARREQVPRIVLQPHAD